MSPRRATGPTRYIQLTGPNGQSLRVRADQIEALAPVPPAEADAPNNPSGQHRVTTIYMIGGKEYTVRETEDEIQALLDAR